MSLSQPRAWIRLGREFDSAVYKIKQATPKPLQNLLASKSTTLFKNITDTKGSLPSHINPSPEYCRYFLFIFLLTFPPSKKSVSACFMESTNHHPSPLTHTVGSIFSTVSRLFLLYHHILSSPLFSLLLTNNHTNTTVLCYIINQRSQIPLPA